LAVVVENVGFGGTHAAPIAEAVNRSLSKKRNIKKKILNQVENNQTIAGVENED
jgi:hypothetical protein